MKNAIIPEDVIVSVLRDLHSAMERLDAAAKWWDLYEETPFGRAKARRARRVSALIGAPRNDLVKLRQVIAHQNVFGDDVAYLERTTELDRALGSSV